MAGNCEAAHAFPWALRLVSKVVVASVAKRSGLKCA